VGSGRCQKSARRPTFLTREIFVKIRRSIAHVKFLEKIKLKEERMKAKMELDNKRLQFKSLLDTIVDEVNK
jgi:hypothetical protein